MSDLARYQLGAPFARAAESVTVAYRALDTVSGSDVALEVLRPGVGSVDKARFATRARRLASVEHPSIFAVVDLGPAHCALELPSGALLTAHAGVAIAQSRRKLTWLAQSADALAALHKSGIAHGRFGLDAVRVLDDGSAKVIVPATGDVSSSPLDDLRAFGAAACKLFLGEELVASRLDERQIHGRLVEAGVPTPAAAVLARACAGPTIASHDLAAELGPFAELSGPTTERLLPTSPPTTAAS